MSILITCLIQASLTFIRITYIDQMKLRASLEVDPGRKKSKTRSVLPPVFKSSSPMYGKSLLTDILTFLLSQSQYKSLQKLILTFQTIFTD